MIGGTYLNLFNQGMTYAEIAKEQGVSRNTVASEIYNYRKEHGIAPTYKLMARNRPNCTLFNEEERKERRKLLNKLKKNEDGITICPPAYAHGYGFKTRYMADRLI